MNYPREVVPIVSVRRYFSDSMRLTMKMPLFSNNNAVYYKPKSLAAGGVGTVRNVGAKSKKT
jgi:hypothetical protein